MSAITGIVADFPGGMLLPGLREATADLPVRGPCLPTRLTLPLDGQVGLEAMALVRAGEQVQRGQLIARAGGYIGACVHAPVAGRVEGLAQVTRPGGRRAQAIVLVPDADQPDATAAPVALPELALSARHEIATETLLARIAAAGLVGQGGAGFPTAVKLSEGSASAVRLLVVNAVECEPGLTCDQRLIRDYAADVVLGVQVLAQITDAERCVIALEDDMLAARQALEDALLKFASQDAQRSPIEVVVVPSRYPSGAERQLIQRLTGVELKPEELPIHHGVVVQNVATTRAVARAALMEEPLTERYVTVLGEVAAPGNFRVLNGTPARVLLEAAGCPDLSAVRLRFGGPLTGQYVDDLDAPLDKRTAALTVEPRTPELPERACIRCGACLPVCPSRLHPPALDERLRNRDFDVVLDFDLFACIECGLCDYVCPSRIPLVSHFRAGKRAIERQHRLQQEADRYREMVEARAGHDARREALADARRAARRARRSADRLAAPGQTEVSAVGSAAHFAAPPGSEPGALPSSPSEGSLPAPGSQVAASSAGSEGPSAGPQATTPEDGLQADIAAAVARVRARRRPGPGRPVKSDAEDDR
jgi:electron transport complex protein RnfC